MKQSAYRILMALILCIALCQTNVYAQAPRSALRNVLQNTAMRTRTQTGTARYRSVPILSFHHLSEETGADLTPASFEEYLRVLTENGFTSVLYENLIAFTNGEKPLPEKPVLITFDDGYASNYDYAFPLLKKWNMKAEIAIVGSTVGCRICRDTGAEIIPHFTWSQAREMIRSGLVSIHSHSYNLHQHSATGQTVLRKGVQRIKGEREEDYVRVLTTDTLTANRRIFNDLGYTNVVYTYPYGQHNDLSERVLEKLGIQVTVTNTPGISDIEWGNPESLRLLRRLPCDENDLDLLQVIQNAYRSIQ